VSSSPGGPLHRAVYCLKCGRPGSIAAMSLDVRHPIITCRRIENDGSEKGCGRQPGTYDLAEADGILRERRRDRATAAHDKHVSFKRRSADCRICETDPPPSRATIHRYEPITSKWRIASHLEFSHADRTLLNKLTRLSASELADYHRKVHDVALATK